MHFYTYKITNLLNGKIYIGVHKTENLEDNYMGSGTILKRSIAKHGIENFKKDILMYHDSESDMFELEALIVDQDFVNRKDTYNLKLGGQGGWDYINVSRTCEDIKRIGRLGAKSLHNKRLDVAYDLAYRRSVSLSCRFRTRDFHSRGFLDKSHQLETIEKVKKTFSEIGHQQGEKNSQFGKMWIHSLEERKSKRINNNEPIPSGWIKGRKMFK